MSDMGVWRQGELESKCIVVRIYGRERMLTYDEGRELAAHILAVVFGAQESLGEDYQGLCVELDLTEPSITTIDLAAIGLAKPKPQLKRRAL